MKLDYKGVWFMADHHFSLKKLFLTYLSADIIFICRQNK